MVTIGRLAVLSRSAYMSEDDQPPPRKPTFDKRRTPTWLNAMGSAALARPSSNTDETGAGARPDQKVVLGPQALHHSDITEGTPGIPLTLTFTLVNPSNGFAPIPEANVEIWHCDADGVFSDFASKMTPDAALTTYLRGVLTTNRAGQVTFRTIYPGWNGTRATHVHVRIYEGLKPKKALQVGFPDQVSAAVYDDFDRYVRGPSPTRNDADEVFGDSPGNGKFGGRQEFHIATVVGDNARGYLATVLIPLEDFA
jgi:protocatechuate 3,4-dioxygenase beta subunit